jgi:hypothetical protein
MADEWADIIDGRSEKISLPKFRRFLLKRKGIHGAGSGSRGDRALCRPCS